jgi:hypothetical protein
VTFNHPLPLQAFTPPHVPRPLQALCPLQALMPWQRTVLVATWGSVYEYANAVALKSVATVAAIKTPFFDMVLSPVIKLKRF